MSCRFNLIALASMAMFAGCYPKSMTGTRTVSRMLSDPVVDRMGDLEIQSELVGRTVVVHASWGRRCHRDVIEIVEDTTGHELTVVGSGGESVAAVLLAVAFYPVGIADLLVTGIVSIADPVRTTRHETRGDPISLACPIPAPNVPLHLTLPSSSVIDGVTDARGSYIFMLAADELHGELKLRADKVQPPAGSAVVGSITDRFVMPKPTEPPPAAAHERVAAPGSPDLPETIDDQQLLAGINAVRARVVACGPRYGVSGIVSVRMTINPEGRVTAFYPRQNIARSVELTGCLGNALAAAHFPATKRGIETVLPFNMADGASAVAPTVPVPMPAPVPAPIPAPAPPPTPPPTPIAARPAPEPSDPGIKALIEKAHAAARVGHCATVKAFSHAISDQAPEYYARVFSREAAVAACLK